MNIDELEMLCKKVATDGFHDKKAAIAVLSVIDSLRNTEAQRDELLSTLKLAETWLEGWASAAHELSIIRAQIAKCEAQS